MRARNIKPGFFKNEYLANLDPLVRLLFTGLWCLADREGRLEDRPGKIKIAVLPCDDCDVDRMLEDLARPQGPDGERFIRRYAVDGRRCIQVLNFVRHQNPHVREAASMLPAPPAEADVTPQASSSSILHQESTVLATDEVHVSPADSLIPDSLIPDSLIADSLIPKRLLTSAVKPAAEDLRLDGFHSSKQTKNQKSQTMNPKTQTENYEIKASCYESPRPRASPPNENSIPEEPDNESYPLEFEQFWQQYPRQTDKTRAFRAWQALLEKGVDAGDLIRAAQHYAAHCRRRRTDPEFIKHPSTFLGPLEVYRDWVATLHKAGRNRNDWREDDEEDRNLLSF